MTDTQRQQARALIDIALQYAEDGWPVFPCNPLTKRPMISKQQGGNGHLDATTDQAQIRAWWGQWPNAMIGCPTGPRLDLWVLDIDIKPEKNIDGRIGLAKLIAQYGALPSTLSAITATGGTHHYFTWDPGFPMRNSEGVIAPGVDVRGDGGYVIVPPSRRADGSEYRWDMAAAESSSPAPGWLLALAQQEAKRGRKRREYNWARTALENECARLATATPGTRNGILNEAAFNLFQIVAGGALKDAEVRARLFRAAEQCGLVADDGAGSVWRTIDSAAQAGAQQPRSRPRSSPAAQATATGRTVIRLETGELPETLKQVEAAILATPDQELYQRAGLVVRPVLVQRKAANDRPTSNWELTMVQRTYLTTALDRIIQFERYDGRAKDYVVRDCPGSLAAAYLAESGRWKLPVLAGLVGTPTLRRDGTPCDQPGYDSASGLLYVNEGCRFPAIPTRPTRAEAKAALDQLLTLIGTFPFVTPADRSVMLSGILTALDRRAITTAPLHAFTSPVAGTGKSMLVDLISILATGRLAPVITPGASEEEMEKRLGAALLAGDLIVAIDNVVKPISGAALCAVLTQEDMKIRVLGLSRLVSCPIDSTFFATGNNLTVSNDLTRRVLLCSLDAQCERPELRKFDVDALELARTQRGPLVAAALTMLRAWHVSGECGALDPLGSYPDWSRRIRDALVWLDQADPIDTVQGVRDNDPERAALETVLTQWKMNFNPHASVTTKELIDRGILVPEFHAALLIVAATRNGLFVSPERLGRWLKSVQGKIINGLKVIKAGSLHGHPLWRLHDGNIPNWS
jgi:hypothetical protein